MKCTQCGQEIHDDQGQANGDNGAALEVGDLFASIAKGGATSGNDSSSNVLGKPARGNGGNRRSRLSPDWQPTQAQRLYCEQQGKEPDSFSKVFKDYYEAKGTPWLNWGKVWEKACREWQGHVAAKPTPPKETLREKELNLWRQRLSATVWNPFWGSPPGEPGCMVPKELL